MCGLRHPTRDSLKQAVEKEGRRSLVRTQLSELQDSFEGYAIVDLFRAEQRVAFLAALLSPIFPPRSIPADRWDDAKCFVEAVQWRMYWPESLNVKSLKSVPVAVQLCRSFSTERKFRTGKYVSARPKFNSHYCAHEIRRPLRAFVVIMPSM